MTDKLAPGCKLLITTGNGSTFTGLLHSFDESVGKFVLKKVTVAGSRLCGLQNFYYTDMTKLQVINELPHAKSSSLPNKNDGNNLMSTDPKTPIPHDVMKAENINTDESAMANINGTESGNTGQGYENGESGLFHGNDENGLVNVNDEYYETDYYTLIYRLGEKFFEAIDYIMGQEAVGVAFEGVEIGRNGNLSVIQISTETDVIAFDMIQLGKEAFVEGLKAVFESGNVMKIIHDCRWLSDMLLEDYKIRLANVFDTQVANSYVYRILHNGAWPRYVESLPSCLIRHLKLLPDDVTFFKEGVQEKSGQPPWLQRPLSKQLLSAAQKNVSYLTQLHKVLLNKMMYEFRMGVEIYLSHVRNMDGDIDSCQEQGYFLPPIFWKIPKLVYLTYGSSQGYNGTKNDTEGKDLPAPKRSFLSHNLVRPRPKDPVIWERYSKPKEKSVIKYDKEGNPSMIFGQKINRNSHANNGTIENGSSKLQQETQQGHKFITHEGIAHGTRQDFSLHSSTQRADFCSKTVNQKECDKKVQQRLQQRTSEEFSGSFSDLINKRQENTNAPRHEQDQLKIVPQKQSDADLEECHGNKNNLAFSVITGGSNKQNISAQEDQLKIVSQKQSDADLEECHGNKNNLAFSVITGGSNRQNISAQEPDQLKASPKKCLSSLTKNVISEQKDIVLPEENTNLTSELSSSDASFSIQRSKIWKMFYANQARRTDSDSHLGVKEVLMKTDTEQAMLTKTVAENDTESRSAVSKLIRVHHDTESVSRHSLSKSSDCNDTPGKSRSADHMCASRSSSSFRSQSPSSDSEATLAHHSSAELNASKGTDLDCCSFLPAGFGEVRERKKWMTDQKQSHKSDNKNELDTSDFLSTSLEEDLCYIPMQGSLKCRQEISLGETSFDFGDPFSDSDADFNLLPPESSPFVRDASQSFNGEIIDEDESMCSFENSELFQKVMRVASSLPFENLKSKLLPSKISLCGK